MDPTLMQFQLRQNADELQDFLKGLESWERDVKEKDKTLTKQKPILKEKLPPVRSQATVHHSRTTSNGGVSKRKKKKTKLAEDTKKDSSKPRIKSFDYGAWDKFNVDEACEEVDYRVHRLSSSSSEDEEEEEEERDGGEQQRREQQAVMEKEKGNTHFKNGQYECAAECYGRAMELDPSSPIMPANRAMALIKLRKFEAAESDCSVALSLDPTYIKAFLRRATARHQLGRLSEAKEDFNNVLKFEPSNKLARAEVLKIEQEIRNSKPKDKKFISILHRLPHLRSKKPLKRIVIEDIGVDVTELKEHSCNQSASAENSTSIARVSVIDPCTPSTEESQTVISEKEELEPKVQLPTETKNSVEIETESAIRVNHELEHQAPPIIVNDTTPVRANAPSNDVEESGRAEEIVVKQTEVVLSIPDVPESSLQFQADWKRLRKDKNALTKYFKNLPPSKYPMLLQQSLETDVFPEVISILHKDYVSCGVCCLHELEAISKVKRFSVAVMFLSKKEQQGLQQLFKDLNELIANDSEHTTQVALLAKKYYIPL